ncbi:MAG: hypothetical protein ABS56_05755 [Lautropia sp. SCN 69-89]|nr:MAG: hypothetical protein ABS56_05755 [Lautropia sp. SCN 69-89]
MVRVRAVPARPADRRAAVRLNEALEAILDAPAVLERHPQIGRPVDAALRELAIGHGRSGYVALYHHRPGSGRIEVLTVRHQREAGFG